jgi:hypothetical protein
MTATAPMLPEPYAWTIAPEHIGKYIGQMTMFRPEKTTYHSVPLYTADQVNALLALRRRSVVDEGAWLVELPYAAGPRWWTGAREWADASDKWTADANCAVRFSRKQDAEAVAKGLGGKSFASEHMWIDIPRKES